MAFILDAPFKYYLYGKKVEHFRVETAGLPEGVREVIKRKKQITEPEKIGDVKSVRDVKPREQQKQAGSEESNIEPCLAYIYGYSTEGATQRLPRPTLFVVIGPATPADSNNKTFPSEQDFQMWEANPNDETVRFDVEIGPLNELVDADMVPGLGVGGAEGATVIRGADGRVYAIPANLESFEVLEEDAKSSLDVSAGSDLGTFRVRSLSPRAALTSRAALASRAALVAGTHEMRPPLPDE